MLGVFAVAFFVSRAVVQNCQVRIPWSDSSGPSSSPIIGIFPWNLFEELCLPPFQRPFSQGKVEIPPCLLATLSLSMWSRRDPDFSEVSTDSQPNWLVVGFEPLWKMMEFVNWDDDSNPIYGKIKNGNQTTHQPTFLVTPSYPSFPYLSSACFV